MVYKDIKEMWFLALNIKKAPVSVLQVLEITGKRDRENAKAEW